MTEAEWLAATDAKSMLRFLLDHGRASERKVRLFACGYARRLWPWLLDERSRHAVEVAERIADGLADEWDQQGAHTEAGDVVADAVNRQEFEQAAVVTYAARCIAKSNDKMLVLKYHFQPWTPADVSLVRDIFGNPFRAAPCISPSIMAWRDATIPRLAQASYDERMLPSGHLEPARVGSLSDALEDAGCTDADLLGHLRGPGPHVRGCWAVDLVLDKK